MVGDEKLDTVPELAMSLLSDIGEILSQ